MRFVIPPNLQKFRLSFLLHELHVDVLFTRLSIHVNCAVTSNRTKAFQPATPRYDNLIAIAGFILASMDIIETPTLTYSLLLTECNCLTSMQSPLHLTVWLKINKTIDCLSNRRNFSNGDCWSTAIEWRQNLRWTLKFSNALNQKPQFCIIVNNFNRFFRNSLCSQCECSACNAWR